MKECLTKTFQLDGETKHQNQSRIWRFRNNQQILTKVTAEAILKDTTSRSLYKRNWLICSRRLETTHNCTRARLSREGSQLISRDGQQYRCRWAATCKPELLQNIQTCSWVSSSLQMKKLKKLLKLWRLYKCIYIVGALYQLKENYKSDPPSPNLMNTNLNVIMSKN